MTEKFIQFEFNYASFILRPYSGFSGSSSQLLKNIIKFLANEDYPNDKRVIDRQKNQKNSGKRELVIISNRFGEKGKRCFGKIALIKNKTPFLWAGKDVIEEIVKEQNKKFIEVTNYVIHFSDDSDPIIMFEYNYEGPRLSDFEYYIRQIAREFKLARNVNSSLHLCVDYEQLDKDIKNVLGVTVKVNASYINRLNWFKALKHLNDDSGYKDVRLELFFNRKKDATGKLKKNIKGLDFARNIISWLKNEKNNIEYLDDLKMSYIVGDEEEIVDLDFIKNKEVSVLKVPVTETNIYKSKEFNEITGMEFNNYLRTGKTNVALNS